VDFPNDLPFRRIFALTSANRLTSAGTNWCERPSLTRRHARQRSLESSVAPSAFPFLQMCRRGAATLVSILIARPTAHYHGATGQSRLDSARATNRVQPLVHASGTQLVWLAYFGCRRKRRIHDAQRIVHFCNGSVACATATAAMLSVGLMRFNVLDFFSIETVNVLQRLYGGTSQCAPHGAVSRPNNNII
jgi:hypothetical protein